MLGALVGFVLDGFKSAFSNVHPCQWYLVPYWALIMGALALSPLTILLPQLFTGGLTWPRKEDSPDVWIIHGKRYNLKPFYPTHPGGSFRLRAARGSDCTGLFESCHVFINREALLKMLSNFEIKGDDTSPLPEESIVYHDDFYSDLKEVIRDHFKGKGKGAHKMPTFNLCLCVLAWIIMWLLIWQMLTTGALWTIPFLGAVSWYLTGNVMHDASHNALVTTPWLNRMFSHAAFPYGINVASWQIQHVMSHHIYTNQEEDVDLYHFEPVVKMQKGVGTVHYLLHWFRLILVLSSAVPHLAWVVPYGLLFGQLDPAHGHRQYDRVKAILCHRAELRWGMISEMMGLHCYWIVCWWYLGAMKALCTQLAIYSIASYIFSFFTQASHLQEECFVKPDEPKASFARHQVLASIDFAPDSFFWGHISGGLNTQAAHHVFPSVSAVHLRSIYPRFRKVCQMHGVALKEENSLMSIFRGFLALTN